MDTHNKAGGYLVKNLPKGDVGEFQNADAGKKGSKKKDDEEKANEDA